MQNPGCHGLGTSDPELGLLLTAEGRGALPAAAPELSTRQLVWVPLRLAQHCYTGSTCHSVRNYRSQALSFTFTINNTIRFVRKISQIHLIFPTHPQKKKFPHSQIIKKTSQISAKLEQNIRQACLRSGAVHAHATGRQATPVDPTKNRPAFLILTKPCSNGEIPATQRPEIVSHFSIFGREVIFGKREGK
jgi:hypothetical protein